MEGIRNVCTSIGRPVYTHRQNERLVTRNHLRASISERPLQPEIAFGARSRICRDYRDKQCAIADLVVNLLIPRISSPQLALVKPDLNTNGPKGVAYAPCRRRILRGIAKEYSPRRLSCQCIAPSVASRGDLLTGSPASPPRAA